MTTRPASPEAFRTYANYLRAWRLALEQMGAHLVSFDWNLPETKQVSPAEEAALTGVLHRMWGNLRALEILNSGRMAPEVLAVHAPIAYYAVHNASRAMLLATLNQASDSHDGVLAQIAQECEHGHLPPPWLAYCHGAPAAQLINGLGQFSWPPSNLTTVNVANAVGFVALSLKTTRADAIDLSLDRQRGNRLRLPGGARRKKEQQLRATTAFDLFYRYRRIAHYGRADDFMAFQTDDEALEFGDDLLEVTDAACWMLEKKVHEQVGSARLTNWYHAYMAQHAINVGEGPVGRRYSDLQSPF